MALLWQLIGEVKRTTVQTSLSLGNKKVGSDIDHPKYPWSESESKKTIHHGDVGDLTQPQVLSILDGLSVQGRERQQQQQ